MRDLVYEVIIRLFRGFFVVLGVRFHIRGAEHLPADGPAVLASNHVSYLDFAFIGHIARRRGRLVRFMAKRSTFDSRITGPFMRAMGHIPVDRSSGGAAYRRAAAKLRRAQMVGVFPEATISRSWTLKPFKPGAARLAADTGAALIPVIVWGGHRILTVDGRWSLRRRTPVTVLIGPPIATPGPRSATTLDRELRLRMEELLDRAQRDYLQPAKLSGDLWWQPLHLGGTAPSPEAAAEMDTAALLRSMPSAIPAVTAQNAVGPHRIR